MNQASHQCEQRQFEDYLHRELPISRFMQVSVREVSQRRILLAAPLKPNRNDKNTGFGGSLASLLFMACWGWLFNALRRLKVDADIVVQDSNFRYQLPVTGDLLACCDEPPAGEFDAFLQRLRQKRIARITLDSWVGQADRPSVQMTGRFVARLDGGAA